MNRPLPYVIYHSPCQDGFTAAWCAYRFFGEKGARYIPMGYSDKLPVLDPGADVYFVDFSLARDQMIALAANQGRVVVLDHHVSAQAALAGIEKVAHNVMVIFDMQKSGARLAWEFFHDEPVPQAILHVEDRDLWRFALPETRAISAALFSHEQDFSVWDSLMLEPALYVSLKRDGEAIIRQEERNIEALLPEVQKGSIIISHHLGTDEILFPVVNAPYFLASEIGNRLLAVYPDAPFSACYRDTASGRRDWSLRSVDGRENVSLLAVKLGGGGHRNASGISEEHPNQKIVLLGAYAK